MPPTRGISCLSLVLYGISQDPRYLSLSKVRTLDISYLTDPASRKAKPACMKKIKRETMIRKNWSVSILSSSNFSSTVNPLYELSLLFTEKDFSKTLVVVVVVESWLVDADPLTGWCWW